MGLFSIKEDKIITWNQFGGFTQLSDEERVNATDFAAC
jgi:hypothetical protein